MNAPHSDELHAYVDGQLPEARRAAVEAWLATHPDEATKVRAWKQDAESLRSACSGMAALPSEPRFEPARIRRRMRTRQRTQLARAAVLVMALGLGVMGGWQLRDARGVDHGPPMADAVTAYRLLAGPGQPVSMDFAGNHDDDLQDWLSRHFGEVGQVPDLRSQGYALQGARLLSTPEGAAAMLFYRDRHGAALGVYMRPRTPWLRAGSRHDGGLRAQYWAHGDTAIAVVSSRFDERARQVAPLVRRNG